MNQSNDGRKFLDLFRQRSLTSAVAKVPEFLFSMGAMQLKVEAKPTAVDAQIKVRFWAHVHSYALNGKRAPISYLYDEICSYTHFFNNILSNSRKIAWILTTDRNEFSEYDIGFNQISVMNETMRNIELTNKKGTINKKNFNACLAYLDFCCRIKKSGQV